MTQSAKDLFLSNDDRAKAHRGMVQFDSFQTAVVFARAEFMAGQPSSEQTMGVNRFLDIFQNLGNKEQERTSDPGMPRLTAPELLVPTAKKTDKK